MLTRVHHIGIRLLRIANLSQTLIAMTVYSSSIICVQTHKSANMSVRLTFKQTQQPFLNSKLISKPLLAFINKRFQHMDNKQYLNHTQKKVMFKMISPKPPDKFDLQVKLIDLVQISIIDLICSKKHLFAFINNRFQRCKQEIWERETV